MNAAAGQAPPSPPRRWLILSHGFNMDGRAASLTVTDKLPHLIAAGITPLVLSAVTGRRDTRFPHWQLLPWGPAGLRFDLRHLIAQRCGRGTRYRVLTTLVSVLLLLPIALERLLLGWQHYWSWMPPAVWTGWRLIRSERPELVYTSGGAYSAHWAGYLLKRLTGVRWIAEVHDPMVMPGVPLRTRNQRLWARIEGMICARADLAWWFTDLALASAQRRHPELDGRGLVILPGAEPPRVHATYVRSRRLRLGHFGSLSATRSLRPLLELLLSLRQQGSALPAEVEIHCFGGALDAPARALVKAHGLEALVIEHGRIEHDPATGQSGRERIQAHMQQMDLLLLIHGNTDECPEYIPSKFYDYLWAQRPVLALTHRNPQLSALVAMHGGYGAEVDAPDAVRALLDQVWRDWRADRLRSSRRPPIGTAQCVQALLVALGELPRPQGADAGLLHGA